MAVLSCLNLYRISESSIRAKMPFSNAFVRFRGNELFFFPSGHIWLFTFEKKITKRKSGGCLRYDLSVSLMSVKPVQKRMRDMGV